jgi:hypothetical protein
MTRWVAQTQVHYVSATPYNWTLDKVMGFVGTRQPAIWMGESAPISVCPGVGSIVVWNLDLLIMSQGSSPIVLQFLCVRM